MLSDGKVVSYRCAYRKICKHFYVHINIQDLKLYLSSPLVDLKRKDTIGKHALLWPNDNEKKSENSSLSYITNIDNTTDSNNNTINNNSNSENNNTKSTAHLNSHDSIEIKKEIKHKIQLNLFKSSSWHLNYLNTNGFNLNANQVRWQLQNIRNNDFPPDKDFLLNPFLLLYQILDQMSLPFAS